jgi:hypothetical protein
MFFQLYDKGRLQEYNTLMTEVRKSTIATLNNVAVALLNKVGEEPGHSSHDSGPERGPLGYNVTSYLFN